MTQILRTLPGPFNPASNLAKASTSGAPFRFVDPQNPNNTLELATPVVVHGVSKETLAERAANARPATLASVQSDWWKQSLADAISKT